MPNILKMPDMTNAKPPPAVPLGGGLMLSPQQVDICEWVSGGAGNAFVEALAGTGKTTTIMETLPHTKGAVAVLAFNKAIADEMTARVKARGLYDRVLPGTFHSFGFKAWRRGRGRIKVDTAKAREACDALGVNYEQRGGMNKLVSLAKQALLTPESDDAEWMRIVDHHDLGLELLGRDRDRLRSTETAVGIRQQIVEAIGVARRLLAWHIEAAEELIDFDDMIYMPVHADVAIEQYDWVMVDEAQDTNEARRVLATRMLRPGGRMLWVGDRHQAIYGFTGADADSVARIITELSCARLPLTTTYRCPRAVVERAQRWVPEYTAHEANPEGLVRTINDWSGEALDQSDAILCRLTAPLVKMAFDLIRRHVPCHVEGRDIGAGLLKLVNRWQVAGVRQLTERLTVWGREEEARLRLAGKDAQAAAVVDRVDTLMVLMENCDSLDGLRDTVKNLFVDGARTLTLSTVHKAKGREWGRVYVLGANLWMPLPWVKAAWQLDQEHNLSYVATTRAKRELVYVNVAEKRE